MISHRRTSSLLVLALATLTLCWSTHAPSVRAQARASSPPVDSLLLRGKSIFQSAVDKGSVDSLKQARALFRRAAGGSQHQALAHYYAALAGYRMNNQFPQDAEDRREPVVQDAIDHLKTATNLDPKMADAWALLTGCYGQMMGMNPLQAMTLSSDADEAMARAKALAPENPRVWIISGTQDFFTPSMFGGDKERALEKFKKAARLAEQQSTTDPFTPSWGHAEAYAWIGIAQMEAERWEAARTAFQNALEVNPEYGWVSDVLLPELADEAD